LGERLAPGGSWAGIMIRRHFSCPGPISYTLSLVLLQVLAACSPSPPLIPPGTVPIDLDKPAPDALLTYWLTPYLDPPRDPFTAGIVYEVGGDFFLGPEDSLRSRAPGLLPLLDQPSINWESFTAFLQNTWHTAAGHPERVDGWMQRAGNWRESEGWIRIPVKGSMSPFVRIVSVKESAVVAALSERARGGILQYPEGTLFAADHMNEGQIVETTIMWKRGPGKWDYASYDGGGRLAIEVFKEPKPLQSPVQCLGCHTGNRAFEPERSFPASASDGPDGARYIDVDDASRDATVTALLNEHLQRSDTILGLYATIYLSRVRSRVLSGRGTPADSLLLTQQGIPITSDAS